MIDYKKYVNYITPEQPFEDYDRKKFPFLLGDIFNHPNGDEFTLLQIKDGTAFGTLKKKNSKIAQFTRFINWLDLFKEGFVINQEAYEESVKLQDQYLIAPRKLSDGTWAAVTKLMYTSAICVDYDVERYIMYESRYCFSHNSRLPSWMTAVYWLAQFEHKMSLPIANCAYRGALGTDPIRPGEITEKYYVDMQYLKHHPSLDGKEIHDVANDAMELELSTYKPATFKSNSSEQRTAEKI